VTNSTQAEFLKHYQPHHQPLYRFCRAIAGNTEDAEDLIQDTIISVMQSFEKINDKAAFKSYLYSVASNLHKMQLRRKKFRAEFKAEEIRFMIDPSQNQEDAADFQIVYEYILALPQKMSEALLLFHISDMSLEEIQKIQGGSLSGVKLRLKRGREKLLSTLNTPQQKSVAAYFLTL
jgi:RNA polymerase sigma-70 factor, ECF subfamily